jgi:outer membrane protein OmpA-like peptidoglycan-associated protein
MPQFPDEPVDVGDRWRGSGVRYVDPRRDGSYTEIPYLCEFVYRGKQTHAGRRVHVITAQYATRYRGGDDFRGDPALMNGSGRHVLTIHLSAEDDGYLFVRDQVDEEFRYADGSTIGFQGFVLTWLESAFPLDRNATAVAAQNALEASGVADVEVETRQEGVAISLQRIHFVPDTARILPDERGRLDAIYTVLQGIRERDFLVIGHTADVGKPEGQMQLSIERAKTIIDELVRRGMDPERFIYEGRGGTDPVAANDTEENRAKNRRVEIIVLE